MAAVLGWVCRSSRSFVSGRAAAHTRLSSDSAHSRITPPAAEYASSAVATGRPGTPASPRSCEAVPGGPLELLTHLPCDDLQGFTRTVESLLAEHAPRVAERIDTLALLGPDDLLQGALTPVVRQPWAVLPTGRIALAIGDAWITNDPITGQGANLGSHCAWVTADAIVAGGPYDESFAQRLGAKMWKFAGPVTEWTNASLQPPPDHVLAFLAAAAHDQKLADLFFNLFNDPVRLWAILSDPDRTQMLVDAHAPADTP
jgi:hypothetical protein